MSDQPIPQHHSVAISGVADVSDARREELAEKALEAAAEFAYALDTIYAEDFDQSGVSGQTLPRLTFSWTCSPEQEEVDLTYERIDTPLREEQELTTADVAPVESLTE